MSAHPSLMRIKIAHLYPEAAEPSDDVGNVSALRQRCEQLGIGTDLLEVKIGEHVSLSQVDLLVMGASGESARTQIATDLIHHRGMIRDLVEEGVPVLAVCGGFQLFGRGCTASDGTSVAGVGVFDAWTSPGDRTLAGDLAVEARLGLDGFHSTSEPLELVGFENHADVTRLGEGALPLGRVLRGAGSLGDGSYEGAVYRNAIGTYLRGPVLLRNPRLTDHLIHAALIHRYGSAETVPGIDDGSRAAGLRQW